MTRSPAAIHRSVRAAMLRRAEAGVLRAQKRVDRVDTIMQKALDERNEADEALSAAKYNLHVVKLSQGNY